MPRVPLSLSALASDALLEQAFAWLCPRRKRDPPHADVWNLRRSWPTEKARIQHELRTGIYRFGLLDRVACVRDGQREDLDLWAARAAVVLKALSLLLPTVLPLSKRCTHLKGHGGAKYAVRQALAHLPRCQYVLKTDVQSYYASIDHPLLLDRLARYIPDRGVLTLIIQSLRRVAERGGIYWDYTRGIPLGSPLSPILGAFFLHELDAAFAQRGLFYIRFMDDILVLAPTRWKLRAAVKVVNQVLASLHLAKHPDKTFIGRIEKGFDWLGYHISPAGLRLAATTLHTFATRLTRLYEQEAGRPNRAARLGQYVRRWVGWATGSVPLSRGSDLMGTMHARSCVSRHGVTCDRGGGSGESFGLMFGPALARVIRGFWVWATVCLGRRALPGTGMEGGRPHRCIDNIMVV